MRCPNQKLLQAFVDGELGPVKRQRVVRHTEHCTSCQKRIEEIESVKTLFREEEETAVTSDEVRAFIQLLPVPDAPVLIPWRRMRVAAAAVAAIALVAGILLGRATVRPDRVIETQTVYRMPEEETVAVLSLLQRVKLVANDEYGTDIRAVERTLTDALLRHKDVADARAVQLVADGEESVADGDYMTAVSRLGEAAEISKDIGIRSYARLQQARLLAEEFGAYETAMNALAELSYSMQDSPVGQEATYLLAACQLALGDTRSAGATVDYMAQQGVTDNRLIELAKQIADLCYGDQFEFETAQLCYSIWAEGTPYTDTEFRNAREIRARLALLEESEDKQYDPLVLYLRAQQAYPREAQSFYAEIVRTYPEHSLADSAFVKWHGIEESRRRRDEIDEWESGFRPTSDIARWRQVAESDAPEEMRAFAMLKLADDLHMKMDGVEEVQMAYLEVADEYPWTETADVARQRADIVNATIQNKIRFPLPQTRFPLPLGES